MTQIPFEPVDLTELQDEGVLMAANDAFFWPLGMALTWDHDQATGAATNLHVRQWRMPDGERETIAIEHGDEIAAERRRRFEAWLTKRLAGMLPVEALMARRRLHLPETE